MKRDKEFLLENVQKIIGTRNRIAHGYDKISDDLIWSIVIKSPSETERRNYLETRRIKGYTQHMLKTIEVDDTNFALLLPLT